MPSFALALVLGLGVGALATWDQHHGGLGTGGRVFVVALFAGVAVLFSIAAWGTFR